MKCIDVSPILLKKCFIVLTLNGTSSPGLTYCDAWKDRVSLEN